MVSKRCKHPADINFHIVVVCLWKKKCVTHLLIWQSVKCHSFSSTQKQTSEDVMAILDGRKQEITLTCQGQGMYCVEQLLYKI